MITKMNKYSFILLSGDKEIFLERLRELGVVDITRSTKPVDKTSEGIVGEIAGLRARIKCLQDGSDELLKSLLSKKSELTKELDELTPWGDYSIDDLSKFGVRFYTCSAKAFKPEWEQQWPLQVVSSTKDKVWFVVLGAQADFPLKALPTPSKTASDLKAEIKELEVQICTHTLELQDAKSEIPQLEEKAEQLWSELNVYLAGVSAQKAAEDSLLVFEGFAPREDKQRLCSEFDTLDIYYTCEDACTEDNPPIKLRNNWFVRLFEPITEMYGMPVYNEFDPTVFLSIFFLLFFAICMGDGGYGILLIAIGLFLKRKKGGLADMWGLIVALGVGTLVVGLVMGTFFGINLPDQAWVPQWAKSCMVTGNMEVAGGSYSVQMILSLIIGVGHICIAMLTKAFWTVRRQGFKDSLSTLGWTLLIVGTVVAVTVSLTGVLSEGAFKWLLIGIAGVSVLGIFIFNKWGRNPLINVGAGLWDTYNMASGLMGDTLSYLRLYALGLAGGMLGQTFNLMATMVRGTDPTWQWLPCILILLLGHAINLAMSCLGAFVHPLRLNFVEFFKNSGYQGQGAVYNPIRK